ncbi:MAG: CRTAC1 family protein [Thermoplasmatota archaeon]
MVGRAIAVCLAFLASGCVETAAPAPHWPPVTVGATPWFVDAGSIQDAVAPGLVPPAGHLVPRLAGALFPGPHANGTRDGMGGPNPTNYGSAMDSLTGGVAIADVDQNGYQDILISEPGRDRLYLNEGDGSFRDATAWLGDQGHWNGTTALFFDYDNDGYPDLFLGQLRGPSRLLHNDHGHGFTDVSASSGVAPVAAVQGAAAADVDGDGRLDLVVVAYEDWWNESGQRTPERNLLYHNLGNGTFREEGLERGIDAAGAKPSLSGAFADYDRDGHPDLMVANDYGTGSQMWHNRGDGVFEERTNQTGSLTARDGMGIVWDDFNGDGWPDFYVSNIRQPPYTVDINLGNQLFLNNRNGTFRDASQVSGTFSAGWSWGAAALDATSDGDSDLYVPGGFPYPRVPVPENGSGPPPLPGTMDDEPQRFFVNHGDGTFAEAAHAWGLDAVMDGRGCAAVDLNNDGAVDLVVVGLGLPPRIYLNRAPQGNFVDLHLVGVKSNRDAVGTMVTAYWKGGMIEHERQAGAGYLSESSPVLHFGLGTAAETDLDIAWPSGLTQTFHHVVPGTYALVEGSALTLGP